MQKSTHYLKILFLSIIGLVYLNGYGQSANGLYTIFTDNTPYISKADLTTGILTHLNPLTIGLGSYDGMSLTTNPHDGLIYASNGSQIATYDINPGTFIDSISIFPLSLNDKFKQMEYNVCDSGLYGMLRIQSPLDFRLAKLNPLTGQLTIVSPQTVGGLACGGCGYTIDPYNHTYYSMFNNLIGIDLYTGNEIINVTPVCPPGYVFNHVEFNCNDSMLYGLSANITTMSKYLATIDPLTGIVTHVSAANNLNSYFWKQAYAGQTLNPAGGEFYFVSGTTNVIGADVLTGAVSTLQPLSITGSQGVLNITYYPQCLCDETTGTNDLVSVKNNLTFFPNPANNVLHITLKKSANILVTNLLGQTRLEKYCSTASGESAMIDISSFSPGIYFIRVGVEVRKFVKE